MRLAALTFLLVLVPAVQAGACSCIGETPEQRMASADAAFIGKVTAVRSEDRKRVYTVAVEKAYKGAVGETAEVRGENPGDGVSTSCAEYYEVGDTLGGYFEGAPHEWFIFTCNRATREDLEAGSAGYPAPTSSGEAVALLAGPFSASSPFAALDAQGRVIAYARGNADTNAVFLSPCPGGRRVLESTFGALRTRRLSDLAVLHSTRAQVASVRCVDASGATAVAARNGALLRFAKGRLRPLVGGMVAAAPGQRVSVAADERGRMFSVNSRTGATRRLTRARRLSDLSVSPDGTRLAVLAAGRLTLYREDGRRLGTTRTRGGREQIAWDGRRAYALPLARHGGAFVAGRLWWARRGVLRAARSGYAPASSLAPVPDVLDADVVALPTPAEVSDPSRFNPSASGGSPPRARRARAGDGAPRGGCPTA